MNCNSAEWAFWLCWRPLHTKRSSAFFSNKPCRGFSWKVMLDKWTVFCRFVTAEWKHYQCFIDKIADEKNNIPAPLKNNLKEGVAWYLGKSLGTLYLDNTVSPRVSITSLFKIRKEQIYPIHSKRKQHIWMIIHKNKQVRIIIHKLKHH